MNLILWQIKKEDGNIMNIDEYIQISKRNLYKLNPECKEGKIILQFLSKILKNVDPTIEIKTIFSTDIFPSIIKFNNVSYLLWDMHFWKIFESIFTSSYLLFVSDIEKKNVTIENIENHLTMLYKVHCLDVLTCKTDINPKLAYRLAQEQYFYRELMKKFSQYQIFYSYDTFTSKEIGQIITYAKLFVALHELHHNYFKTDLELHTSCIKYYQAVMEVVNENVNLKKMLSEKYGFDLMDMELYKKDDLIEEAVCDFHAFKIIYELFLEAGISDNPEDIIEGLYCAFCVIIQLVCSFKSIIYIWIEGTAMLDKYYKENKIDVDQLYTKIDYYNAEMYNRISLLKLVIYSDLDKFNLSEEIFEKGDRMTNIIINYIKPFFDLKYLAIIHHDSMNLKVEEKDKSFILDSINLLLGTLYE